MPAVKTRSTARTALPPATKRWHEGYANQAVKQTAGFYTHHPHHEFNYIWLGTDPAEADALVDQINDCIRVIREKGNP